MCQYYIINYIILLNIQVTNQIKMEDEIMEGIKQIEEIKQIENELPQYYDVEFLLDRAYNSFSLNNEKISLVAPKLIKENRKSYVPNFQEVCKSINRDPDDVRKFIGDELQKGTSIKENGQLKIDITIRSVGIIESLIKKYIIEFVRCKSCKSCKTTTQKIGRITYLVCDACKSRLSVDK